MLSTIFQNGQRIIVQVLNFAQAAWQSTFSDRNNDFYIPGICKNLIGEFTISAGSNNTSTTPSITVGPGVAYSSNVTNRIYISLTDTTSYNSSNPSQTTDDGTGNLIPTPQSTGCVNIPLTINSLNYVWIDYLATIDPTVFTLQDVTLAKQFYQQGNGYKITVTTTNVSPTSNSIYLGSVNLTGSGVVSSTTISQVGRTYTGASPYRTFAETPATNLSDRTTSYTLGNTYFLDDHTKAVGSGTVSATNPHGLSALDIGLSGSSTVQFHQEYLHSPGLVGGLDNLQAQIINVTPGFDRLIVNPIGANEVLTSNGISLTSTDISTATTLQYSPSDNSGTWYIYADVVNKIVSRTQTNLILLPNPNQYLLYTVVYTYPDPDTSNGHLSALTDYRVFGNTGTREIQAGAVTGVKIASSAVAEGLSKDTNNNIQVNVDGTSIAINGSNDLSVVGTGLAGNGLVASGSTLSVNPDGTSINIISNQVEVANLGITTAKIASGAVNGSTSNSGSQQQIAQGTVSTPDLRANSVTIPQFTHASAAVGWILNANGIADLQILTFNLAAPASLFISAFGTVAQTGGSGNYTGVGVYVDSIGFIPSLSSAPGISGAGTLVTYANSYMVTLPAGTFSVRVRVQRTGVGPTSTGQLNAQANLFAVAYYR